MGMLFMVVGGALSVCGGIGAMVLLWRNGFRRMRFGSGGFSLSLRDLDLAKELVTTPEKRGELMLLVLCIAAAIGGGVLLSFGVPS